MEERRIRARLVRAVVITAVIQASVRVAAGTNDVELQKALKLHDAEVSGERRLSAEEVERLKKTISTDTGELRDVDVGRLVNEYIDGPSQERKKQIAEFVCKILGAPQAPGEVWDDPSTLRYELCQPAAAMKLKEAIPYLIDLLIPQPGQKISEGFSPRGDIDGEPCGSATGALMEMGPVATPELMVYLKRSKDAQRKKIVRAILKRIEDGLAGERESQTQYALTSPASSVVDLMTSKGAVVGTGILHLAHLPAELMERARIGDRQLSGTNGTVEIRKVLYAENKTAPKTLTIYRSKDHPDRCQIWTPYREGVDVFFIGDSQQTGLVCSPRAINMDEIHECIKVLEKPSAELKDIVAKEGNFKNKPILLSVMLHLAFKRHWNPQARFTVFCVAAGPGPGFSFDVTDFADASLKKDDRDDDEFNDLLFNFFLKHAEEALKKDKDDQSYNGFCYTIEGCLPSIHKHAERVQALQGCLKRVESLTLQNKQDKKQVEHWRRELKSH